MPGSQEICGNCTFFDPNGVNKKPIGKLINKDGEVTKGLCRAKPNGLLLSERLAIQSCSMPEGAFVPKKGVVFQKEEVVVVKSEQT